MEQMSAHSLGPHMSTPSYTYLAGSDGNAAINALQLLGMGEPSWGPKRV